MIIFKFQFYCRNGRPYWISDFNLLTVTVSRRNVIIPVVYQLAVTGLNQTNSVKVQFKPRSSGTYTIEVLLNGCHISGSPFLKRFYPGG